MRPVSTMSLAPRGPAVLGAAAGIAAWPRSAYAAEIVEYVLGGLRLRELSPVGLPELPPWFWGWLSGPPAAVALLVIAGWIAWRRRPGRKRRPRRLTLDAPGLSRRGILARVKGASLVIVSRQHPVLFDYLARELRADRRVEILVDRRWGERRNRIRDDASERRRGDRRRSNPGTDLRHHPFVIVPREKTVEAGLPGAVS
jgi:hypothetical protein